FAASSIAAPIAYTLSGTASGYLNGVPFTNAAFTTTGIGDSSAATQLFPGTWCNEIVSVTFAIGGIGSGTVTQPMHVHSSGNAGGAFGFGRGTCVASSQDWIDVTDASFAAYHLDTAAGPTTPTSTLTQGYPTFPGISTTGGSLDLI